MNAVWPREANQSARELFLSESCVCAVRLVEVWCHLDDDTSTKLHFVLGQWGLSTTVSHRDQRSSWMSAKAFVSLDSTSHTTL